MLAGIVILASPTLCAWGQNATNATLCMSLSIDKEYLTRASTENEGTVGGVMRRTGLCLYVAREDTARVCTTVFEKQLKYGDNFVRLEQLESGRILVYLVATGRFRCEETLAAFTLTEPREYLASIRCDASGKKVTGPLLDESSTEGAPSSTGKAVQGLETPATSRATPARFRETAERLKQLKELRDLGVLTEEEYESRRKPLIEGL